MKLMVPLTETRTPQEVCDLFNMKYHNIPITQSIVSKIENTFREFWNLIHVMRYPPK